MHETNLSHPSVLAGGFWHRLSSTSLFAVLIFFSPPPIPSLTQQMVGPVCGCGFQGTQIALVVQLCALLCCGTIFHCTSKMLPVHFSLLCCGVLPHTWFCEQFGATHVSPLQQITGLQLVYLVFLLRPRSFICGCLESVHFTKFRVIALKFLPTTAIWHHTISV